VSLTAVLATGFFAGGVSCAAVQGGLLTGLVARQQASTASAAPARTTTNRGSAGRKNATGPSKHRPTEAAGPGLVDGLVPVGGFLAGKLVSHSLLGALLGGIGTAVQLSAHGRALAQLMAGALIVAFGLAQLGVPGFRGLTVSPPASWLRFVRGRARSQSAIAPAILGFATILVPCGVTLSVMALALASGSPMYGAVTMAVFVVGTSPLFTLIGYAAHKASTAWKDKLAIATGVVLVAMGLHTLNGGLTLVGSPLAARNLAGTFGLTEAEADASTITAAADGTQTAVITVGAGRYSPENVLVKAGTPTTLVFRSENALGCVRALVIPALGFEEVLPEQGETSVDAGVLEPGRIDYSCAMGMYSGTITIE